MSFDYKIEDVAGAQVLEAMLWYENHRQGLGDELYLCFEEAIQIICRNPFYENRYKGLRIYNIHRFPYQIVYKIEVEMVIILAFFHARRDPKKWQKL